MLNNKILTAQVGSNAANVGERPRYNPRKPSFCTIFWRLVIMTLPDCLPKDKNHELHGIIFVLRSPKEKTKERVLLNNLRRRISY